MRPVAPARTWKTTSICALIAESLWRCQLSSFGACSPAATMQFGRRLEAQAARFEPLQHISERTAAQREQSRRRSAVDPARTRPTISSLGAQLAAVASSRTGRSSNSSGRTHAMHASRQQSARSWGICARARMHARARGPDAHCAWRPLSSGTVQGGPQHSCKGDQALAFALDLCPSVHGVASAVACTGVGLRGSSPMRRTGWGQEPAAHALHTPHSPAVQLSSPQDIAHARRAHAGRRGPRLPSLSP